MNRQITHRSQAHAPYAELISTFLHKGACLLFILTLSACSLFPTETPDSETSLHYDWPKVEAELISLDNWSLFGKLGIRTSDESLTVAINKWQQTNDQFEIDISSTFFGLGASKLYGNDHFLSIVQPGEEPVSSFEPDKLIESALGFPLPISYLQHWIKGLPAHDTPFSRTYDTQGLVASLKQDGWSLSYSNYHTEYPTPLPGKIKIQRNDIRIIVAVKEWTHP